MRDTYYVIIKDKRKKPRIDDNGNILKFITIKAAEDYILMYGLKKYKVCLLIN